MTDVMDLVRRVPLRRFSWARIVSDVISPPIVWAVLVITVAIAFTATPQEALYWSAIYSLFICVIPIIYIFVMVWLGKIGDIHMKERRERYAPFLLALVCSIIAWWILRLMSAPPIFVLLSVMTVVEISIIALITLFWQISMHAMTITGASVAVGVIFEPLTGLLLIPVIVLVGAARLKLKRHTPAQVLAGALVGAFVPILFLLAMPAILPLLIG